LHDYGQVATGVITGGSCKLDHLGVAVPNLDRSIEFYRAVLGCDVSRRVSMPDQGIEVAMLPLANTRVELLAPIGRVSPLWNLLEDRTINDFMAANPGGGLHHLCFVVADIEAAIAGLAQRGGRVLGDGHGIVGVDGTRVLFLDPGASDNVLIELKQPVAT
jgi:methylmalonyl-CoA/ethylmalonyl-CoA epimerase